MAELLSPAGGWDSLVAAVQSGADAVYMGFGAYNARRSAKNFTEEKDPKFEVYLDKGGEYRFRLKATNGQIIAVSEGYKAMAACRNGIASVKKNAPDSPVVMIED